MDQDKNDKQYELHPVTGDDDDFEIEDVAVKDETGRAAPQAGRENGAVTLEKLIDEDAKHEVSRRPFEDVLLLLEQNNSHSLKPFVKLGTIDHLDLEYYSKLIKDVKKGVKYIHFETQQFKYDPAEMAEGSLRTGMAGCVAGGLTFGPLGALIGMSGGMVIGPIIGSPTFHLWRKTLGKKGKEQYYLSLESNFKALDSMAVAIEAKLDSADFTAKEVQDRLNFFERGAFIDISRSALYGVKKVHKSYLVYVDRINNGWRSE